MAAATGRSSAFGFGFDPLVRDDHARAALVALCTVTLVLFFSASWLLGPRSAAARTTYLAVYGFTGALCVVGWRRGCLDGVRWHYIALGVLSVPTAIMIGRYSPLLGDLIALLFYPTAALALSPPSIPEPRRLPVRWEDRVLLVTGLLTLCAYAASSAATGDSVRGPGLYRVLAPAAAVVLIWPFVATMRWQPRSDTAPGLRLLLSGLLLVIAADLWTVGDMNQFLWATAMWVVGLGAALVPGFRRTRVLTAHATISSWPVAAAGGIYMLVAFEAMRLEPIGTRILIIGGTTVSGLLLVRQIRGLRELQGLRDRVARAERLEAVGRATADVAHEFNNLLTLMVGHLDALETVAPAGDRSRESLAGLRQATSRAVHLTRSLLGRTRMSRRSPRLVDANLIVQQVISMLQPSLGAAHQIRQTLAQGPCFAYCDDQELFHALMNLAINAKHAMPQGGSIAIETSTVVAAKVPRNVPLQRGDYSCIVVRDCGVGMTPDVIARAFDPFFTTKAEGHGAGLGLAIVSNVVRQSGGFVDVASAPGLGSTVTLWLPSSAPADDKGSP